MKLAYRAVIAGLLFVSTAYSDTGVDDPARFFDPEEWDMTVSYTCSGTQSGTQSGLAISETENTSAQGSGHLTTLVAVGSTRRLNGSLKGSFKVSSQWTGKGGGLDEGTVITSTDGDPGPKARVRLEISADGTYVIGIDQTKVKTKAVTTVNGQSVSADQPYAGDFLSEKLTVPAHGDTITGSQEIKAAPCRGSGPLHASFKRMVTWKLTPKKKLEAKPKLVAAFHRGEQAQLDGSDSTGHPSKYKWTVTPRACKKVRTSGCGDQGLTAPEKTKEDKNWSVTLLCDADAKLEVSDDSGNKDDKTIPVIVTPRSWTMGFSSTTDTSQDHPLGGATDQFFGANECNVAQEAGRHWIHAKTTGAADNNWRTLVDVTTLHESDSPFDNYAYVSDQHFAVGRTERVNAEFYAGSGGGQCKNGQTLYDFNASKNNTAAITALASSVAAHEKMHSTLAHDALTGGSDPLLDVERVVDKSEDGLRERVQNTVKFADNALSNASGEDKVHAALQKGFNKTVTIWLCSKSTPLTINLANNGDDALGALGGSPASCSSD